MPDPNERYNAMQANLGIIPGQPMQTAAALNVPSPGDTSLRLMQQAETRSQQSYAIMSAGRTTQSNALGMFGAQFQEQLNQIRSQQSVNPFVAQALALTLPGSSQYQAGMLPSPLTMTPPGSGMFRPPPTGPNFAPIPPMYTPMVQTPFTPRMPAPMFQSPWEQRVQATDIRAGRWEMMGMEAPRLGGQALGYGAGAYAGARMGGRLGPWGAMLGAAGGGLLSGAAGIPRALGNIADFSVQIPRETRVMGTALQRMSQDWVVTGGDLSRGMQGLSRDAGIRLAQGVRDLAADRQFRSATQDQFNREDLTRIAGLGGQAGLFDMAQSVPQIRRQLQQTALTIRQFMELTRDPDVTNIIRRMGQLRQLGLTQQEMIVAAQGMRTFSRAAGMSMQGLQAAGGMPGAMTFQQAGLLPGAGLQYGNFALSAARQAVATGAVSTRELGLLGGVQGIAQREMQGQAAFASMPLFAAAMGQYGPGGWGLRGGAVGANLGGPQGMVTSALANVNQAVQQGGIGALASFPLRQRAIQSAALMETTPQQQMAQRYQMAMQAGRFLGMRGENAFAAGAQMLFGPEQAEQMLTLARSPRFWRAQQQTLRGREQELAYEQRQRIMGESPILGGIPRAIYESSVGRGVRGAVSAVGEGFEMLGAGIAAPFENISEFFRRRGARGEGVLRRDFGRTGRIAGGLGERGSFEDIARMRRGFADVEGPLSENLEVLATARQYGPIMQKFLAGADFASDLISAGTFGLIEPDVAKALGGLSTTTFSEEDRRRNAMAEFGRVRRSVSLFNQAKRMKEKDINQAVNVIDKAMGGKNGGLGYAALRTAASKIDKIVVDRGKRGIPLTKEEIHKQVVAAVAETGNVSLEKAQQIATDIMKDPTTASNLAAIVTHEARQQSRDPSIWLKQEERDVEAFYEQLDEVGEDREERIQEAFESTEERLGLDPFWGMYSGTEEEVQRIAAGMSGKEFALMGAILEDEGASGDRDPARLQEFARKYNVSQDEIKKARTRARSLMRTDDAAAKRIAQASKKGGISTMVRYAQQQAFQGAQPAWRSRAVADVLTGASEGFTEYLATGGSITGRGVAEAFTEEDIGRLEQEGGTKGKMWAGLLRKAKTGDAKALGMLTQFAVRESGLGAEGVEETVMTGPEGEEAERIEASKEAISSMQDAFKDFKPAVEIFREGSQFLNFATKKLYEESLRKD